MLLGAGRMVARAMIAASCGWRGSLRLLVKDTYRRKEGLGILVDVSCTCSEAFCSRSEGKNFRSARDSTCFFKTRKNETTSPPQGALASAEKLSLQNTKNEEEKLTRQRTLCFPNRY